MGQQVLLGVDVGTSGIKVAAFDSRGRMLVRTVETYPSSTPAPGWLEVDAEAVWNAAVAGIRACVGTLATTCPGAEIAGVGVCGLLATMGIGEGGEVLTPAVLWSDCRAAAQMQSLLAAIPRETLVARAGRPPAPERSACVAMWWRDARPDVFRRIRWIVSLKDFLVYRLTGRVVTDWMNAAYTLLFDVRTRAWRTDFMDAADLPAERFPPSLSPAEPAGPLHAEGAARTGLPEGIPVAVGGPDGSLAAVGAGSLDENVLVDTAGTSDTVLASTAHPTVGGDSGLVVNPHVLAGRWLIGGPTTSTGAVWSWWAERFGRRAAEEKVGHAELDAAAASVPPGADGLIFLPTFIGDRTPGWTPTARGALIGLDLGHGPAHVARAIVEGTALMVRRCLHRMRETGAAPARVHLVGGAANSPLWTQVRADMLGLPVVRLRTPEASAWGAALMGGLASGFFPDPSAITLDADLIAGTCQPDPRNAALYDDLCGIAEAFLDNLDGPFERLAGWRERYGRSRGE